MGICVWRLGLAWFEIPTGAQDRALNLLRYGAKGKGGGMGLESSQQSTTMGLPWWSSG